MHEKFEGSSNTFDSKASEKKSEKKALLVCFREILAMRPWWLLANARLYKKIFSANKLLCIKPDPKNGSCDGDGRSRAGAVAPYSVRRSTLEGIVP
ncbi:hypothetical protein GOD90_20305 [Sinorhizobium medicae]|nr:hypothetical protein [Sinorhizobium medicae]MDX0899298.1 hypothetical protein [Sinorhizobium medicae]MDX1242703.1 hypothetical protein [Sinorhizobium medicae]